MPKTWRAYTPVSDDVVQVRTWNTDTENWDYDHSIVTFDPSTVDFSHETQARMSDF